MKKILVTAFIGLTLSACSDTKKQEKDLSKHISFHEDDEKTIDDL
jgi:hypothetical protein